MASFVKRTFEEKHGVNVLCCKNQRQKSKDKQLSFVFAFSVRGMKNTLY